MWEPQIPITLEASRAYYGDSFTFLYADYVRTSQETQIEASRAYYEDSFTLLYADDVRTSQETQIEDFTAHYGNSFPFYFCLYFFINSFLHNRLLISSFAVHSVKTSEITRKEGNIGEFILLARSILL
jgi:hypothetical protein